MATTPEWFYMRLGKQVGPLTSEQLKDFARRGIIMPSDQIWKKGMADWVKAGRVKGLFPRTAPVEQEPEVDPEPPAAITKVTALAVTKASTAAVMPPDDPPVICGTCHIGHLIKCKRYRMSTPVVIIGYILLVPSILGIITGIVAFILTSTSVADVTSALNQTSSQILTNAGVPKDIIDTVNTGTTLSPDQLAKLTPQQKQAVDSATIGKSAACCGLGIVASLAGFGALGAALISFIGGLLGWILIMKKRVLQCHKCGAVVAAS